MDTGPDLDHFATSKPSSISENPEFDPLGVELVLLFPLFPLFCLSSSAACLVPVLVTWKSIPFMRRPLHSFSDWVKDP
jgi:hypothetical protein